MSAILANVVAPSPSRLLFASLLVQVGQFRCPTGHPQFPDSGPTKKYCFVFPRTAVWIQHEGGSPFVADSTIVPLYNAGFPYARRPISRDGDRTDWFGVSETALRDALAAHGARSSEADRRLFECDFTRTPLTTFFAQRRVFEYVRAGDQADPLYVEESVLTLLDDVLSATEVRPSRTAPPPTQRALSEDARALVNVSFTGRHDLTELARSVGASVFHLCRAFRRCTGQTIHGYRNQLRLRRSLELIADSDDLLCTALALGYSGHSHFTAAFHRSFGITPSEYRALSRSQRAAVAAEQSADN